MLKQITIMFIMTGLLVQSLNAQDYCKIKSCKQKRAENTMCKYSSSQPASACGKSITKSSLTADEKQKILNLHNKLRQVVAKGNEKRGNPGPQPAAQNMATLEWDDELEKIAQRWAIQCNFNHDQCRDVERFVVGQNIGEIYTSKDRNVNFNSIIQSWYDEVSKFDKNDISKYRFDPETGHYTQLVWANTTKIGCGAIVYKSSNSFTTNYLVCNYGVAGNFINQPVYQIK